MNMYPAKMLRIITGRQLTKAQVDMAKRGEETTSSGVFGPPFQRWKFGVENGYIRVKIYLDSELLEERIYDPDGLLKYRVRKENHDAWPYFRKIVYEPCGRFVGRQVPMNEPLYEENTTIFK